MLDVVNAKRVLESRWVRNGFVKLDEPEEGKGELYVAMKPQPEEYNEDFDFLYLEPAMQALEEAVAKEDGGKYYLVDVYYDDDVLSIISSCGKVEPKKVKNE